MVKYECKFCYFTSKNKCNFIKHVNTKKHIIIVENDENMMQQKNELNEKLELKYENKIS